MPMFEMNFLTFFSITILLTCYSSRIPVDCGKRESDLSEDDLQRIQNEYMEKTNEYRQKHHSSGVCTCPELVINARSIARRLAKQGFLSPEKGIISTNMAESSGDLQNGSFSVNKYYATGNGYKYWEEITSFDKLG